MSCLSQEEGIKAALEKFGFQVEKIEERDGIKTPDFYVQKDDDQYTIELKTKQVNQAMIVKMKDAFSRNEIYSGMVPIEHSGTIQGLVRDARKQLASKPIYEDSFNLAWFHCEGHNAVATMELFEVVLYGKVFGSEFGEHDRGKAFECYYYKSIAMFNKYQNILDGAVITGDESIKILLNIFSPKYEAFKQSSLCRTFEKGVQDPLQREADGNALVVTNDMYGSNINENIAKKYGFDRFITIPMQLYLVAALHH